MSSGAFQTTRYELNDTAVIVPFRAQPETIALTNGTVANDPPAGDVTLSLFAKARKGVREYGIGTRLITISWEGSPPAGYEDDNLTIPILTVAAFNAYTVGSNVTYLGTQALVVGRTAERLR